MERLSGILFPHTLVQEEQLEGLAAYFSRMEIAVPFLMHEPDIPAFHQYPMEISFFYPHRDLHPPSDFKALLAEYRQWMLENRDSTREALIASSSAENEYSTWNLRKMISGKRRPPSSTNEEDAFRWHLVLHLAAELEENRQTAEDLYKKAIDKGSPIRDAITDSPDTAAGLKQSEDSLFPELSTRTGPVLEAWFALFGYHLEKACTLVTLDRSVWDFASRHPRAGEELTPPLPGLKAMSFSGQTLVISDG